MSEIEQPQTTLRETLEANLDASEAGTLPTIEEVRDTRPRDEVGRFAPKPKEAEAPKTEVAAAAIPPSTPKLEAQAPQTPKSLRPTTWKAEYMPIWDKLAAGVPITPDEAKKLADYSGQRENEYKTGVSTYKAEAMQAKELQEAITPFLPELQANGLAPAAWIKQLGHAHYALAKGTPELKLQVFRELARQYNVPLGAVLQNPQQVPQIATELMGQNQAMQQQLQQLINWRQQQESSALTGEIDKIAKDTAKYPHFEAVRGTMAQLLEHGLAQDLHSAYTKAIWMQDDVREAEQLRIAGQSQQTNAVVRARSQAVSPKSATPSGQVATTAAKDRRSLLENQFDSLSGGRV